MAGVARALAVLPGPRPTAPAFDETNILPTGRASWRRATRLQHPLGPTSLWGAPACSAERRKYQALFEASLADQAQGCQGRNARLPAFHPGMPRIMTIVWAGRARDPAQGSLTSISRTTCLAASTPLGASSRRNATMTLSHVLLYRQWPRSPMAWPLRHATIPNPQPSRSLAHSRPPSCRCTRTTRPS